MNQDDTFCYYCQVDTKNTRAFIIHLRRLHQGSYAYYSYVPEALQDIDRRRKEAKQ